MLDENPGTVRFQTAWECICVFRTNRTRRPRADFCHLRNIRDEWRGVDPSLVFKGKRVERRAQRDLERAEPGLDSDTEGDFFG
ncbi:hypothetical protein TNCV_3279801 [Trichonephila clavipes]|nr:hypothetical protein TNCV_3279801 [Trichonephila clavipes]